MRKSDAEAANHAERAASLLVIYLLVLPDPLPIAHQSTWTRKLDEREPLLEDVEFRPLAHLSPVGDPGDAGGNNFVSLRFWQVRDDQADVPEFVYRTRLAARVAEILGPGAAPDPDQLLIAENPESYRTVVEAVTFVARPDEFIATEDKPDPLTRCVRVLIGFHRAYRLATRAHVPELTYERLHPAVEWLKRPAFDSAAQPEFAGLILLTNHNIPVPLSQMEPLSNDALREVAQYETRGAAGDPFAFYAERRLEAEIEAHTNGRPRESVVQTGIAAEVLLGALLGIAMWEEFSAGKLTIEQAAIVLSDNVTSRIKTQYSQRFGGKWLLDVDPMRRWESDIATPRNRVVHAGFEPGKRDAYAALDALHGLEKFIGDRLAAKWKTYPRTAWLFLGTAGFQRRGHKRLRDVEEWLAADGIPVTTWIRDYQAWREHVIAGVVLTR